MQDAQSDIKKLQKKHKDNKEELNKAMAAMYKEKGINPLGCILPLIIQMPIWFALFRVLRDPLDFIPSSSVLFKDLEISTSLTFFNMDLQIPPSEVSEWIDRIPYLVLILLVILTALYQQQQITKKSGKSDNPQAQQMQMVGKVMPLFFGFISWTLPTGLVVYFLTGNIFRIGQQGLIVRLDGREEVKNEEKKEESSENTETNPIQENPRKNRKKRRRK
jgi:YidC/Oxa1 family membrane protein insertase